MIMSLRLDLLYIPGTKPESGGPNEARFLFVERLQGQCLSCSVNAMPSYNKRYATAQLYYQSRCTLPQLNSFWYLFTMCSYSLKLSVPVKPASSRYFVLSKSLHTAWMTALAVCGSPHVSSEDKVGRATHPLSTYQPAKPPSHTSNPHPRCGASFSPCWLQQTLYEHQL